MHQLNAIVILFNFFKYFYLKKLILINFTWILHWIAWYLPFVLLLNQIWLFLQMLMDVLYIWFREHLLHPVVRNSLTQSTILWFKQPYAFYTLCYISNPKLWSLLSYFTFAAQDSTATSQSSTTTSNDRSSTERQSNVFIGAFQGANDMTNVTQVITAAIYLYTDLQYFQLGYVSTECYIYEALLGVFEIWNNWDFQGGNINI